MPKRSTATIRRLEASMGTLASAAIARMDEVLPWYRAMPAENRSWVNLVAQAGVAAFVEWFRQPEAPQAISADVFGTAPRELTRSVTLQQTVELVRVVIAVVEEQIEQIAPGDEAEVREAVLRYSREIAFAAAEVYAQAAEARGAWDARLEALVVDSVLRAEADEAVQSRASALGWAQRGGVTVVLGAVPSPRSPDLFEEVRRAARGKGMDALCATQGDRLVVILGGVEDADKAASAVVRFFGEGPVVVGPRSEDLNSGHASARAALSGLRAASGWPDAPRPVATDDLLPERVLAGDGHARRHLVEEVYVPLRQAKGTLIDTLTAYFQQGQSLEAAARALFVHPNTVRYRLRQASELTGLAATDPRDALTLQLALVLGRQSPRATGD
jgi:hypothetical protein